MCISLFLASLFFVFLHDCMLVSQLILYNIKLIQPRFTYCVACALDKGLPFYWEICTEWLSFFLFSMVVQSSSNGID
jgi:hypothetical protein